MGRWHHLRRRMPPDFVAVGGTSLAIGTGGAWAYETSWSGSSGGVSALFPQPAWQRNIPGTIDRGRILPDVAFDADPSTGTALYIFGTWNSAANPIGGRPFPRPYLVRSSPNSTNA